VLGRLEAQGAPPAPRKIAGPLNVEPEPAPLDYEALLELGRSLVLQVYRGDGRARRRVRIAQASQDQFRGLPAASAWIDRDRGQRRRTHRCLGNVVETDHREIIAGVATACRQARHQPQRDRVVVADRRGRGRVAHEQRR